MEMVSKSLRINLGWPHPESLIAVVVNGTPARAVSSSSHVTLTNLSVIACRRVGLSADSHLLQSARFDHFDEDRGSGWAEKERVR